MDQEIVLPPALWIDLGRLEHVGVVVVELPHAVAEAEEIIPNGLARGAEVPLQRERMDFDQQARQVALDRLLAAFDKTDFGAFDIATDEVDARELFLLHQAVE